MRKNRCVIMACLLASLTFVACGVNDNHDQTPDSNINTTTSITTCCTECTTTESVTTSSITTSCITPATTEDITTVEVQTETETKTETEIKVENNEITVISDVTETHEDDVQVFEPVPVIEYVVYKPSTHYIHRSSCRWNTNDAYEINDTNRLEARRCSECNPDMEIVNYYVAPVIEYEQPTSNGLTYFGYFSRVTYYPATAYYNGVCGGSGRTLLGYGNYDNGIRGSIASRSLYETYGYNRNGRTTVYLEFPGYENMNGYYYVDDCCANYGVIDVFVWDSYSCPFYNTGVITADCYI